MSEEVWVKMALLKWIGQGFDTKQRDLLGGNRAGQKIPLDVGLYSTQEHALEYRELKGGLDPLEGDVKGELSGEIEGRGDHGSGSGSVNILNEGSVDLHSIER